jgi:hypothetical protein
MPQIDVIVRGEGEETAPELIRTFEFGRPLKALRGIAFRDDNGVVVGTPPAPVIADAAHGAVAAAALGEMHRGDRAAAPQGAAPRAVSSRPENPPRHALVHQDGPPGLGPHEIIGFLFRDRRIAIGERSDAVLRTATGPTLARFWGAPQDAEEEAMASKQKERSIASFDTEKARAA